MMKILIATALLIGSTAASAASNAQPALAAKGATAHSTVYCFEVERTGSYIISKVCQTERTWEAEGVRVPRK